MKSSNSIKNHDLLLKDIMEQIENSWHHIIMQFMQSQRI